MTKKIFLVFLICTSITIILNSIGNETLLFFFKCSLVLLSFFLFLKELKILVRFFLNYMFLNPTFFFDKFIERPRLFVYATAGNISLFILFIYFNRGVNLSTYFYLLISNMLAIHHSIN